MVAWHCMAFIGGNQLVGTIPSILGSMQKLKMLWLGKLFDIHTFMHIHNIIKVNNTEMNYQGTAHKSKHTFDCISYIYIYIYIHLYFVIDNHRKQLIDRSNSITARKPERIARFKSL